MIVSQFSGRIYIDLLLMVRRCIKAIALPARQRRLIPNVFFFAPVAALLWIPASAAARAQTTVNLVLFAGEKLPDGGIQLDIDPNDAKSSGLGTNRSYALGTLPSSLSISAKGSGALLTGTVADAPTGTTLKYSVDITDTDTKKEFKANLTVTIEDTYNAVLSAGKPTSVTVLSGAKARIEADPPDGAKDPKLEVGTSLDPWGFSLNGQTVLQSNSAEVNAATPAFKETLDYTDAAGKAQSAELDVTVASSGSVDLSGLSAASSQAADQDSRTVQPAFDEAPQAGSQQLLVTAATSSTLIVYSFSDSSPSNTKASACTLQGEAEAGGSPLQIVQGSGTSQTTGSSYDVSSTAKSPFNLTLQLPLVAGSQLQLAQTSGSTTTCSDLVTVNDPNSQGPHQFFLTLGAYISNQQANSTSGSSGSSTSASQYVEAAWKESWFIPPILIGDGVKDKTGKCNASTTAGSDASGSQDPPQASPVKGKERSPAKPSTGSGGLKYCHGAAFGITTLVAGRLASIPVSTSVTSTSSSSSGSSSSVFRGHASSPTAAASTVNALNVLSSQDSFRFVGLFSVPFLVTRVANSRAYTFAFTGKAGIDTLVNSSGTLTTSATSTASAQSGIPQFNQVYNFRAAGLRFDFAQAPSRKLHDQTGAAPQTIAHIDVTYGPYSNLQSYVCTDNSKLPLPGKTLTTACGSGTLASFKYPSRMMIPRIEVDGSARIASTPFVMGIDANLGQYAIGTGSYHVDDLNKPGNDVRIFIGTSVNISSFISALEKIGAVVQ